MKRGDMERLPNPRTDGEPVRRLLSSSVTVEQGVHGPFVDP